MNINVQPQSKISLCNVPWNEDYKNVRSFASTTAQSTYMASKVVKSFSDVNFTYLRKDKSIVIPCNVEVIRNANYCYYVNTGFSNKVYYAFITKMEYVSENSTRIFIETDVYQTWQFNITYNTCFVEREHCNLEDDKPGNFTYPENLETGEPLLQFYEDDITFLDDYYLILNTTYDPEAINIGGAEPPPSQLIGGQILSGYLFAYDMAKLNSDNLDQSELVAFLTLWVKLNTTGHGGDIVSMYAIPKFMCPERDTSSDHGHSPFLVKPTASQQRYQDSTVTGSINEKIVEIEKPNNIFTSPTETYVCKNKKLMCAPYKYLAVSNNAGIVNTYKYEDFYTPSSTAKLKFKVKGTIGPGCSIKLVPTGYKAYNYENEDEGIMLGKFPTFSWTNDAYTNWLSANSINIAGSAVSGITSLVAGGILASTYGGMGFSTKALAVGIETGLNALSNITNLLGSLETHEAAPDSVSGNTTGGDINFASKKNTFLFKHMNIKVEYAKIIDNFFEMYGYKTFMTKVPNINNRPYWNYVKTIDCNFEGTMPEEDLTLIRRIFNNGVTIWHTDDMYDYTNNNHATTV